MFIVRVMPKSYIQKVQLARGFSLIVGSQHYPPLAEDFAKLVRDTLKLPVFCVRQLPDTAMKRFETWHMRQPI
jgi:hypothetical protein